MNFWLYVAGYTLGGLAALSLFTFICGMTYVSQPYNPMDSKDVWLLLLCFVATVVFGAGAGTIFDHLY